MGHEVIGADKVESHIETVKDYISTVYNIDSTEEASLQVLPLNNVDLVIVAIGENFGASIRTVALLKKAGVRHIYARAIDKLHESILESFEIDRILTPEQRAASDLSSEMELGTQIQSLPVDDDYSVLRFSTPDYFVGVPYRGLDLEKTFGLTLVAACRKTLRRNVLGLERGHLEIIDFKKEENAAVSVEKGDVLTVFGPRKKFREFYRHING